MKRIFSLATLICLFIVALTSISCSKSDDPADNEILTYSSFCRMESSLTTDIHWCSQQFKRFRDISTFEIVQ